MDPLADERHPADARFGGSEVRILDIDPKAAGLMTRLLRKMVKRSNGSMRIEATGNQKAGVELPF